MPGPQESSTVVSGLDLLRRALFIVAGIFNTNVLPNV